MNTFFKTSAITAFLILLCLLCSARARTSLSDIVVLKAGQDIDPGQSKHDMLLIMQPSWIVDLFTVYLFVQCYIELCQWLVINLYDRNCHWLSCYLHTDLSESEHSRPVNNALAVLQDRRLRGVVLLEYSPGLVQYDMCVSGMSMSMTSHNDRGQLTWVNEIRNQLFAHL